MPDVVGDPEEVGAFKFEAEAARRPILVETVLTIFLNEKSPPNNKKSNILWNT